MGKSDFYFSIINRQLDCRPQFPSPSHTSLGKIRQNEYINVIVFNVGGFSSKDMIETKLMDPADSYDLDVDALLGVKSQYRDPADLGEISDREFWIQIPDPFGVEATVEDTEIDSHIVLVEGTLEIAKSLFQEVEECLFIDNNLDNPDAAQSAGIRTILI